MLERATTGAFLTAMYSLFAGAMSRKTYTMCETRGGITGVTPAHPQIWMARLAVIDDQIADDELHLLRLLPLAWCQPGQPADFEDMPTEFGPVSLRLVLSRDSATLDVSLRPAFRSVPDKVILHVPPLEGLLSLRINGREVESRNGEVELKPEEIGEQNLGGDVLKAASQG